MSTLQSVPRELRDHVLHHVILAQQNDAPSLDQSFNDLIQDREILLSPRLGAWCKTVLYQPTNVVANASSLLLVNHQIRRETQENIKRLGARQYDLDVIILDEILPLPTWLRIPVLTNSLDAVNVTFRIAGKFDRKKQRNDDGSETPYRKYGSYRGFGIGNGAGPAMGWQIYGILERFIKAGPVGKLEDNKIHTHRHMTVKTIDINVETPQDVDPSASGNPISASLMSSLRDDADTVLSPEYLARFVAQNMNGLLAGGDREWFAYGKVLYEYVDFIVIRHDGVEIKRLDVAERLRGVGGFQEKYVSEKELQDYKAATWAKRKIRGLRVLSD